MNDKDGAVYDYTEQLGRELAKAEAKIEAVWEWISDNLYEGRCVNATDEQLLRDEIASELSRLMQEDE